jgi:predicted ATPase
MSQKLPNGWVKTTLGEITQPSRNRVLPEDVPTLAYVGLEHIEPESMRLLGHGSARDVRSSSVRFGSGDVLYGKMRPYLNKVWVAEFEGICSAEFLVFPKSELVNSHFLAGRLNASDFVAFANAKVSGERPRVDFKKLSRFPILLPPIAEQERIVRKLHATLASLRRANTAAHRAQERLKRYSVTVLDAAINGELTRPWRENQSKNMKVSIESDADLLQRILSARRRRWEEAELARFVRSGKTPKGDKWKSHYPAPTLEIDRELPELPEGWIWVRWEQVGLSQNGRPFPSKEYSYTGVKLLRPGNLHADGSVRWTHKNTRYMPAKWERRNPDLVIGGNELVINLTAQSLKDDFLGRVCLTSEGEHCLLNQRLARLTPVLGISRFFLYVFKSTKFRRFVSDLNSGSLIQHMFTSQLNDFCLPFPPEMEQTTIVKEVERRVRAADHLASKISQELARSDAARQSLAANAFAGELIPQDPKDEHASLLLERIRVNKGRREQEKKVGRLPERGLQESVRIVMPKVTPSSEKLRSVWQKLANKTDAKRLFIEAGFDPEQVLRFYEILRDTPEVRSAFREAAQKSAKRRKSMPAQETREVTTGRFRLVELWLEDFKNLRDYRVSFDPAQGVDIVLGWNGTGKSNLFEALVIIFRDLHDWCERNRWHKPMKGFRLVYEMEEKTIEISWVPAEMRRPELKLGPIITRTANVDRDFQVIKREQLPLPRFVFGYYSGPTNRLSEHFLPMKQAHYIRLRDAKSDDSKTLSALLEQRRFFCAETHHAKYVLLSFCYREDKQISEFLHDRLRIAGFESALFVVRKPDWSRNNDPNDFWGARGVMRRVLKRLQQFAIAPLVLQQSVRRGFRSITEDHYYFFLPDRESLQKFAAEYDDARTFFLALESTDFSELIYDVKVQVRVKATPTEEVPITFHEMSEGEQQLLMVLGLIRFTKSNQSLILLDEPDTHLNPHWSVDYLKLLYKVMSDDGQKSPEQQSSQILVTTHDPLVIASLDKEQIHLLKRDADLLSCYWEQPLESPRGMGYSGILMSEMFGFRSDLDSETLELLDKQAELATKGSPLSQPDREKLEKVNQEVERLGFRSISSDPYYREFLEAMARNKGTFELMKKETQTRSERETIRKSANEVLSKLKKRNTLDS